MLDQFFEIFEYVHTISYTFSTRIRWQDMVSFEASNAFGKKTGKFCWLWNRLEKLSKRRRTVQSATEVEVGQQPLNVGARQIIIVEWSDHAIDMVLLYHLDGSSSTYPPCPWSILFTLSICSHVLIIITNSVSFQTERLFPTTAPSESLLM